MAYTNPQQWLDLLRRRPGTRMTDLGVGSNVLEATGPFLNRQSASPQSDWRSRRNEGDARRQQSAAYGTPIGAQSMAGQMSRDLVSQPQNIGQSVADLLAQAPGSKINDIGTSTGDGTENKTQDPQGFLGQIGSYLSRENTPELLLAAGGAMSQAASQPGSSFLGSLGAGTAAGVEQRTQQRTLEAARAKLAAETETDRLEIAQTKTETQQAITDRQEAIRQIGEQRGIDPIELAKFIDMAKTEGGYEYGMSIIAPDLKTTEQSVGVDRQNWDYYEELLTDAQGDPDLIAKAEKFWASTQSGTGRPAQPIQISDKLEELADPGWKIGMPYNDAQTAFLAIAENIPPTLRGNLQTFAQRNLDDALVTEAGEWDRQGRFIFNSKVSKFNEILETLDTNNNISGGLVGTILESGWIPEWAKSLALTDAVNTLDLIRGIVYESLRDTLGPQFTENEGKRLVAASYNKYLPEEMNRTRIIRLKEEIEKTAEAKNNMMAWYNEHGTFANYENPYVLGKDGDLPMAHLLIEASDYDAIESKDLATYIAEDIRNFSAAEARAMYVDLGDELETEAVLELRKQLLTRVN